MVDHFNAYIYHKRGFYYCSRRVPKQLQHCHSKQRIVLALNTKSRAKALKHAQVICQRWDERWLTMRLDAKGLKNVLTDDVKSLPSPLLSEATHQYLQLRGMGKGKTFHQAAMRNSNVVIEMLGDRPLRDYSTVDSGSVRDTRITRGLSIMSVKRTFITVRAIFNLAIEERGFEMHNPFASIFTPL